VRTLDLNLARKPFVNARPIGRAATLLWFLGGILLVFNAVLYWDYFTSSEDRRDDLTATQARIAEQEAAISTLRSQLQGLQLPQQNAQVAFLNRKIAERTFGWSRLFDDLEEVLPGNVRLLSLSPQAEEADSRRPPQPTDGERVRLNIDCIAKDGGAQLEFIDQLFAAPAFSNPQLSSDAVDAAGLIRFQLSVVYHPHLAATETVADPAGAEDGPGGNEDGTETDGNAAEGEET
jgi:Tfp pilus assembly protein PilN